MHAQQGYESNIMPVSQEVEELKVKGARECKEYVYRVHYNGKKYILKGATCSGANKDLWGRYRREFMMAQELARDSPYIEVPVALAKEEFAKGSMVRVELLIVDGGECLEESIGKLTTPELLSVALQTAHALTLCHEKNIFHSDIKPGNIVMQNGRVQIIDFGASMYAISQEKFNKETQTMSGKRVGWTALYEPPAFKSAHTSIIMSGLDIYSWGMTMYQLLMEYCPESLEHERDTYFRNEADYETFLMMLRRYKKPKDPYPKLTALLIEIIASTLVLEARKRPDFKTIKEKLTEGPSLGLGQRETSIADKGVQPQETSALREEIARLNQQNIQTNSSLDINKKLLAEKDKEIANLVHECKSKQRTIDTLKAAEVERTKERAENTLQTISKLNATLALKEAKIEEITTEIANNMRIIESLTIARDNQAVVIKNNREEILKLKDMVERLTQTRELQAQTIAALREEKAKQRPTSERGPAPTAEETVCIGKRPQDPTDHTRRLPRLQVFPSQPQPEVQLRLDTSLSLYIKAQSEACEICKEKTNLRNLSCRCPICKQCLAKIAQNPGEHPPKCPCGLFLSPELFLAINPNATKTLYKPCCFASINKEICTGTAELISNSCGQHVYCRACLRHAMQAVKDSQEGGTLCDFQCSPECSNVIDISVFFAVDPQLAVALQPPCALSNDTNCQRKAQIICSCSCAFCAPCIRDYISRDIQVEGDISALPCPNCKKQFITSNLLLFLRKKCKDTGAFSFIYLPSH